MKKCIPLLAALCLLLCGCTAPTPPVSHTLASSSTAAVSTTTTVTTTAEAGRLMPAKSSGYISICVR